MKGEAILCVDDDGIILLAIKQELKRRFAGRYYIEIASDASEATAVIADLEERGVRTVLVISDYYMPGVRGDQFLVELHARRPDIKAILITGQADLDSVDRTRREAGLFACVQKPWRPEQLYRTIEDCLAPVGGAA